MELTATRALLYDLMESHGYDTLLARRLGLSEDAARSLCWLSQSPSQGSDSGSVLTLSFDDKCSGRALPRAVKSALRSESLPVRAARGNRYAAAHTWVKAKNFSNPLFTGTLGAILRRSDQPSRIFGLTAGHVVGAAPDARMGDKIHFVFEGEATAPISGRLLDWQPNFTRLPQSDGSLDAGVAEIDVDTLQPLVERPREWPIGTASVFADDLLQLRTQGTVNSGSQVTVIGGWLTLNRDTSRAYFIRDAIGWTAQTPTQNGDSGAPVWNASDELVGIHVGGQYGDEARSAIAVPIGRILRWAGSDIVRRNEPIKRPTVPLSSPPSLPVPPGIPVQHDAADVLARTMYGEARREGQIGMTAVGHVVLNRVNATSWWGRDVISVCQKPWQFSCWNLNDPNRNTLLRANAAIPHFRLALDIAAAILAAQAAGTRESEDPTYGATHYFAPALVSTPRWAIGHTPCARIGGHLFFKDIA